MATSINRDELKSRLNIELGDSGNITFTDAEKSEFLRKAVNDPLVYKIVEITQAVTFNTRSYPLNAKYEAVVSVGYDSAGDGFPVPLPGDAYDFVNGSLIIDRRYMNLPGTNNLYLQVACKLNWADDDSYPEYLSEYIIENAIINSGKTLASKKVNLFLKNETTMGELMARINEAESTVKRLRRTLRNQKLVRI